MSEIIKKNWEYLCGKYGIDRAQKMLDLELAKEARQTELEEIQSKALEREEIRTEIFSEVKEEFEESERQLQTQKSELDVEIEGIKERHGELYDLIVERGKVYDAYLKKLLDYRAQLQSYDNTLIAPIRRLAQTLVDKKMKRGIVELIRNDDGTFTMTTNTLEKAK